MLRYAIYPLSQIQRSDERRKQKDAIRLMAPQQHEKISKLAGANCCSLHLPIFALQKEEGKGHQRELNTWYDLYDGGRDDILLVLAQE